MKNFGTFFYIFLYLNSMCLCMESDTVNPVIKQAIIEAPNISFGAGIFNEMVKLNHIAPTVANTRWCIHTLADKPDAYKDILLVAQQINSVLACEWLAHYLLTGQQFAYARTRLKIAIETNNNSLASFLLSSKSSQLANSRSGEELNQNFAYYSANYDRAEILKYLIFAGANIHQHEEAPCAFAPIHIAAWRGYLKPLQVLLDAGIDPNFPCKHGYTALFHLCASPIFEQKHLECAFLLLDHGAHTKIIPAQHLSRDQAITHLKMVTEQYNLKKRIV